MCNFKVHEGGPRLRILTARTSAASRRGRRIPSGQSCQDFRLAAGWRRARRWPFAKNLRGGGALLGHHRWAVSFHGLGVRDKMRWPAAPRRTLTPAQIDTVRVVRSGRPRFARMLRKIAATHAPLRREASRFARPLARALCDAGARQTPGRLGVAVAQIFFVLRPPAAGLRACCWRSSWGIFKQIEEEKHSE